MNLTQQQLDEVLEHQNQMLRHQELLLQKKNELRLLEECISTNQQIIEQQQQQQQQQQQPPPQPQQQSHQNKQQINANKKAKKEKAAARTLEFHSPDPTTASQAPQPVSTGDSAEASSPADDGKQHQFESTTRLKPLTERRLKRKVLWKKYISYSPPPERSEKKQSLTNPRVTPEHQSLETSSSMSSSMFSSTFHCTPKTHISKSAVMEFYLKEKLREASVREFEMMLMNN